MLISFTIENYRSFKERHRVICQPCEEINKFQDNIYETESCDILKVISIFGHNASGKSNIIKALQAMKLLICYDGNIEDILEYIYRPFSYNEEMQNKPTFFEIDLLINNRIIRYGITFDKNKVYNEELYEFCDNEKIQVLKSNKEELSYDMKYSGYLKKVLTDVSSDNNIGNAKQFDMIRQLLEKNIVDSMIKRSDFKFRGLLNVKDELALAVKNWFTKKLVIIDDEHYRFGSSLFMNNGRYGELFLTDKQIPEDNKKLKNRIIKFISDADLSIKYIFSKEQIDNRGKSYSYFSQHNLFKEDGSLETINMDFFQTESQGTQRLFTLSKEIINVIDNGGLLVVDELDRNLHPLLLSYVVQYFNSGEKNGNRGQLLFTTHASELLDIGNLREDQVLFVSKDYEECSSIYPLFKYDISEVTSLSKAYLFGSFGAIPILPVGYNFGEK